MFDHTPDFHCAPARPAARPIPTIYQRERIFNTFNLLAISVAFFIGWVLGSAVAKSLLS